MNDRSRTYGMIAEFDQPEPLLKAIRRARKAGYERLDAYTPFPVPELAEVLGLPKSPVPLLALIGGVLGAGGAFFMQWYSAAIDYPWIVAGRPYNSWPSFVPITFELGILTASLFIFIGLFAISRLPRLHHPIFNAPRFRRVSRDRFFLLIEAGDPRFDPRETRRFLESLGSRSVNEVKE